MHSKFSHQYLFCVSLNVWQDQESGAGIRTDAGQCAKKPWPWSLVKTVFGLVLGSSYGSKAFEGDWFLVFRRVILSISD